MKLLAINTASIVSIALFEKETLLAEINALDPDQFRAEDLPLLLNDLIEQHQWKPQDITHLAVATGPGGYTGLRSGLAFTRTLAQMQNIPVISVNTLEAMAMLSPHQGFVLALLDARMKEFSWALYHSMPFPLEKPGKGWILETKEGPTLSSLALVLEVLRKIQEPVTILGSEGLPAVKKAIFELLGERAIFLPKERELHYPLARGVGMVALFKIQRGEVLSWMALEPYYARPPVIP